MGFWFRSLLRARVIPRIAASFALIVANQVAFGATAWTINATDNASDGVCDVYGCTLRDALTIYDARDTMSSTPPCSSTFHTCGIDLSSAVPNITENVTINGPGGNALTARRASAWGVPVQIRDVHK